jgi:GDP-fucose transporter C1
LPGVAYAVAESISQSTDLWTMHTQYLLIFAGVLGTLMNIASFFQIKYTSALTHNVSGTAKSCVQSILAWFIYQYVWICLLCFGVFLPS